MSEYGAQIRSALDRAAFELDELAFFTWTGKVERQVCDRLAWRLHQSGLRVVREWQRTDLAVLDSGKRPVALLEAKAGVTADFERGPHHRLLREIVADAAKARGRAPGADIYLLVIVTHIPDPVPPGGWAKYDHLFRRVADQDAASRTVAGVLESMGPVTRHVLGTGTVYSLRVSVDAWLCGPVAQEVTTVDR